MPHERRVFGDAGERVAERVLAERGWRVLERNARTRYGEIDLVCHDGRGYVFVEVKTRHADSFVAAAEAVSALKIAKLRRLAGAWLALHGARQAQWRLALAALTVGPRGTAAQLIDIIE